MELAEILKGLKNKVDVSIYATDEFSWEQMRQIRLGLEAGINVSSYTFKNLKAGEMNEIYHSLIDKNFKLSNYLKVKISLNKLFKK